MSSFPGMRKLRITANDTKSLATKYSQAHFIYGNTEWFTAYVAHGADGVFHEVIDCSCPMQVVKPGLAAAGGADDFPWHSPFCLWFDFTINGMGFGKMIIICQALSENRHPLFPRYLYARLPANRH